VSTDHRILVFGQDPVLRDLLHEQFAWVATITATASDRAGAPAAAAAERPFDAILAASLGEAEDRETIAALRQGGFKGPVLVVAPAGSDEDTERWLDAGANDVMPTPFRFSALLLRTRALLRAFEASGGAEVPIGPYTFHAHAKTMSMGDGTVIRLTDKEAAILRFLYRSGDEVVSRDTLLQGVWGYNPAVTTHTLETHVYRLRQKLEADRPDARILLTEPGGYRLLPA
jgi:DNA-binding response OmpR family regulator